MKSNIALIGFMGTGKTVVGKALAKKLNKKYIGIDDLIVKKSGKSISRIFEEDGKIRFRELEIETVKEISEMNDIIIDCGGGIVLNMINIERLKNNAIIFLLTAQSETISKRILKEKEKRPLLEVSEKMKEIKDLLSFRKPFYNKSADYIIDTSNLDQDEVVKKILEIWKVSGKKNESKNRKE